jgi:hypothetical protein
MFRPESLKPELKPINQVQKCRSVGTLMNLNQFVGHNPQTIKISEKKKNTTKYKQTKMQRIKIGAGILPSMVIRTLKGLNQYR